MLSCAVPNVLQSAQSAFLITILLVTNSAALSAELGGARTSAEKRAAQQNSADVYYVNEVADRFTAFATKRSPLINAFHMREQKRLEQAMTGTTNSRERSLLEEAITANEESRLDTQEAAGMMMNFVTSLKRAMGAEGRVASCKYLTCGAHAYCQEATEAGSANCRCDEGYEGNGFICRPPTQVAEHPLIDLAMGATAHLQVADMHINPISGNRVAVVYRDLADSHKGYLMLGQADHTRMKWGMPVAFSGDSEAYGPVVAELQDGSGLAIAFRDKDRDGTGFVVAAALDPHDPQKVAFGEAKPFARHQANSMALVPLPDKYVAVLFAEHALAGSTGRAAMYGSAMMARVHANNKTADVDLAGKNRFVTGPVARISAAMLSPSSFVVAFRHGGDDSTRERREASCLVAQARSAELAFTRQALQLEPRQSQIWARSVAAVRENVFAYMYHSGTEQLTKQAFVQVDPVTRRLSLLREPQVVGRGFTPFVGMVSTLSALEHQQEPDQLQLLQQQGPRLLTYFSEGSENQARFCMMGGNGLPDRCKGVTLSDREMVSVTGTQLGDGRAVFVFTDVRGAPYYHLVGLMDQAVGA